MRFRKSLRIGKGMRLNFSKSGMSFTAGMKGASVNFGNKGAYLNAGIPGTGLYDRKKISNETSSQQFSDDNTTYMKVGIHLEDDGKISIKDENNTVITDESLIRKIKRKEVYKSAVEKAVKIRKAEVDNKTAEFVEVYMSAPALIERNIVEKELNNLKFKEYKIKKFDDDKPTNENCKTELQAKANREIGSIFFWKNKGLRKTYVEQNLEEYYSDAVKEWETKKNKFEKNEEKQKEKRDKDAKTEYFAEKERLENILESSENHIETTLAELFNELKLPVEFSVGYELKQKGKTVCIDLDLPEIEDLNTEKADITASGKLSVKKKSKKVLNEEYAKGVAGLAYFFAAHVFNISFSIDNILISGYTQRNNPKNGKVEDQYIYSILFERGKFQELNIQKINPLESMGIFKNVSNIDSSFLMKPIEPF